MLTVKERIKQAATTCRVALSVNFEAQLEALVITEIDEDADTSGYSVTDGIATLKIRGLLAPNVGGDYIEWGLTGYDVLVDYLNQAEADESVTELWLDVDSDGGFAEGIGAVVAALADFSKPVRTFVTGNMNSAAYHIGCAGSPIVATNELSLVGSIGAYAVHTEYSAAFEREGIKKRLFKSDYWKGAFNFFTPLSEREEEKIQGEVDETANRFREVVANYRQLTVDEIKSFDGDHFRSKEALTKKLIDEIGELPMPGEVTPPATTSETAKTFTQADIDAAVAEANRKSQEASAAKAARIAEIKAHPNGTDALKEQFASDDYAGVPMDKVKAALDASTPTPTELLDTTGGAGVAPDRSEPPSATTDAAKEKAENQAAALEIVKKRKGSVL